MYSDIQITIQIYWRFAKFRLNFPALCHFLKKSKQTQGLGNTAKSKKASFEKSQKKKLKYFSNENFFEKKNPILRQSDYF